MINEAWKRRYSNFLLFQETVRTGVMKIIILFAFFLATTCYSEDLTTKSGKVYKEFFVDKVSARGLNIIHDEGLCTVPFEELPNDLREKYSGQEKKIAVEEASRIAADKERAEIYQQNMILRRNAMYVDLIPRDLSSKGYHFCDWSRREFLLTTEEYLLIANREEKELYEKARKQDIEFQKTAPGPMGAGFLPINLHPYVSKWNNSMFQKINSGYADSPETPTIVVEDLPPSTITYKSFKTFVYSIGIQQESSTVYPKYTVNREKALRYLQKNKSK